MIILRAVVENVQLQTSECVDGLRRESMASI